VLSKLRNSLWLGSPELEQWRRGLGAVWFLT